MQKPPTKRSEIEIDRIINLLKGFKFFQNNKKLSYCDYRDLAQMMTYKEYDKDAHIYDFDQVADSFYVVLNGQACELIQNPNIDNWQWANEVFTVLNDWKENVFDPYAQKQLQEHQEKMRRLREEIRKNQTRAIRKSIRIVKHYNFNISFN